MAHTLPNVYRLFAPIFDTCKPYLVVTERNRAAFRTDDLFGLGLDQSSIIDPQRLENRAFLKILDRQNILNYGPAGLEMPQWAFYDCALMPGIVFGFAAHVDQFPEWAPRAFEIPDDYSGMVPMSMFIAIPLVGRSEWLGYTLSGLREVSWGLGPPGVNVLSLIMACKGLGIDALLSVNQWRSWKLQYFAQLGPLWLKTAYTPAHTEPRTLTFRLELDDERLLAALEQHEQHPSCPPATECLDVDDTKALRALQWDLENGARIALVGRPKQTGARIVVPIHRAEQGA